MEKQYSGLDLFSDSFGIQHLPAHSFVFPRGQHIVLVVWGSISFQTWILKKRRKKRVEQREDARSLLRTLSHNSSLISHWSELCHMTIPNCKEPGKFIPWWSLTQAKFILLWKKESRYLGIISSVYHTLQLHEAGNIKLIKQMGKLRLKIFK